MRKTVLFLVYHEPTVHMCYNVSKVMDESKFKAVFVTYEDNAKEALKKRDIPYYSKRKQVKKILEEIKPDLVVTPHNLNPIGYLFVKNAKKKSIKTLLLHEGGSEQSQFLEEKAGKKQKNKLLPMTIGDVQALALFKLKKQYYGNQYMAHSGSDVVTVMSEKSKQFMKKIGVKSKVVITGQPRFDDIINKDYNDEETRKKYHIKKDKKTVLLLTSIVVTDGIWSEDKLRVFILRIQDIVNELGYQLILKIHPREDKKFYDLIDKNLHIITDDLYDIINISDVVISIPSTTTLEALMFEKPVLIPDFLTKKSYAKELGLNTGCNSYEEIKNMLKNTPKVKGNLKQFVFKTDGKASERVAKLIGELC